MFSGRSLKSGLELLSCVDSGQDSHSWKNTGTGSGPGTEIEPRQGSFLARYLHICSGFSPPSDQTCVVFSFRPSANENKQSSRPSAAPMDQHSSPSKYAKPGAEHAAVARVEPRHLCVVEFSNVCDGTHVFSLLCAAIDRPPPRSSWTPTLTPGGSQRNSCTITPISSGACSPTWEPSSWVGGS